ncbi:MAG TPA: hypothetical protein PKW33_07620 [Anaerolineaceae bacterium]|nr:hypothetical protein [Anaerolineaceae bacterium]HPN51440.1 hypothetical protein [Anaerolineaceae bacterium]
MLENFRSTSLIHHYRLKDNLFSRPWLSMIIFTGIIFRLQGLFQVPFWYNEVFSVAISHFDLFTMIQKLQVNISPPLWEILIWFMPRFGGTGDLSVRILPCMFSIITLFLVWKLTNMLHLSYRQKIFCLGMLALMPYQAWVARDVRVYSLYTMLYTLSIIWLLQKKWIGLTASIGLLMWAHNTAIIYAFSLGVLALGMYPREWKKIFLCFGLALASLLPWLPALTRQGEAWVPFYGELNTTVILDSILQIFFAWSIPIWPQMLAITALTLNIILSPLLAAIHWILHDMRRQMAEGPRFAKRVFNYIGLYLWPQHPPANADESERFTALLVIIPFSLFTIAGLIGKNAVIYRTFTALTVPVALWFALSGVPAKTRWYHKLILFCWAASLLFSLTFWKSDAQGGNLYDIIDYLKVHTQRGDVIYHATGTSAVLFKYYLPQKTHVVIDEPRVFAEDVKLLYPDFPQAALEDVPHKRAWIIWSTEEHYNVLNPHMIERMKLYTMGCLEIGMVNYLYILPTKIFLCENHYGTAPTH